MSHGTSGGLLIIVVEIITGRFRAGADFKIVSRMFFNLRVVTVYKNSTYMFYVLCSGMRP